MHALLRRRRFLPRTCKIKQNGTVKSQIEIMPSWQLAPYSQLPIRQLALSVERTGFNSSTYARIKPVAVTATGFSDLVAGISDPARGPLYIYNSFVRAGPVRARQA